MNGRSTIIVAATLALGLGSSGTAFAGDCNQVRFRFINKWTLDTGQPVDIRVTRVNIQGNQGNWNENIANMRLEPDEDDTTGRRRLNLLDSGQTGTFTVHFDHRTIGPGWQSAAHGPFDMNCDDGDTLKFTIMH